MKKCGMFNNSKEANTMAMFSTIWLSFVTYMKCQGVDEIFDVFEN